MLSMFIQACYNIVDSIFVSRVSEDALTAVSLAFPADADDRRCGRHRRGYELHHIRRLGERRYEEPIWAPPTPVLMAVSALLFTFIGITLTGPFFRLFTDDAEILSMGTTYLSICLTFCLVHIHADRLRAHFTGDGQYAVSMLMQMTGAITNIILDPILIFGYLGFPAMGVAARPSPPLRGSHGMLFSFGLMFFKKHDVSLRFRGFRPSLTHIRGIMRSGRLPSSCRPSERP
jgi:Na+-driven multidrug efflux pump